MDRKAYENWNEFAHDAAVKWLQRAKETSNVEAVMERQGVSEDDVIGLLEWRVNDYYINHQPSDEDIWNNVDNAIDRILGKVSTVGQLRELATSLRAQMKPEDHILGRPEQVTYVDFLTLDDVLEEITGLSLEAIQSRIETGDTDFLEDQLESGIIDLYFFGTPDPTAVTIDVRFKGVTELTSPNQEVVDAAEFDVTIKSLDPSENDRMRDILESIAADYNTQIRTAQQEEPTDYYDVNTDEQKSEMLDIAVRSLAEQAKAIVGQFAALVDAQEDESLTATLTRMDLDKQPLLEAARTADNSLRHLSEMLYDLENTLKGSGDVED